MANAILIPGKEKRVYGGHPWVFRSDIARVEGDFTPGDIVSVYSSKGKFLAKAFYNPQSQISLRIMSLHDEPIDRAFIFRRVKEALPVVHVHHNVYRMDIACVEQLRFVAQCARYGAYCPCGLGEA